MKKGMIQRLSFQRLIFLAILIASASLFAQAPVITKSGGWFETAYVEWQSVSGAESYNVYVNGNGISDRQIDAQLIRGYDGYYRADAPGLAAGDYTLTVVPVSGGAEGTPVTTSSISVMAHDRTGFAFANGRVPGAYKADGTPKDGAVIIYLTEDSKNTISMNVTGANSNPCVGLQTILEGFKKGDDTRPLIIRMIGQITDMDYMNKGDIVIENNNNSSSYITLEGIGEDAVADGWGIRMKNASNIEIRNLAVMNVDSDEGDNIGLQQNNDYIWVHHIDFFYGGAGGDSDQAKGDGALDCKRSTYVTFSYNHFWDTGKSNLLGLGENTTEGLFITYHHNWYDHSDSRHPRVRFFSAHVYNNLYDGISKYGVGSTEGSSVFVEGNYFTNAKYPMLISMQGSDVWDESAGSNDYGDKPTFSSEDGGIIKAWDNYIEGAMRFVAYGDGSYANSTTDFDAWVASSRNEQVPGSVTSAYGNNSYNNFDTDASVMYSYTAQSPQDARTTVMNYAGRMNGGDFSWTFGSGEDTNYDVIPELKSALVSYSTSLQTIQGPDDEIIVISSSSVSSSSVSSSSVSSSGTSSSSGASSSSVSSSGNTSSSGISSSSATTIDADIIHNFTTDEMISDYFSITGNLSDSKGTVNYGGETLTQCLKMESATSITFTTEGSGTLTLVFNSDYNGGVNVDGVTYTATNGIVEITIDAGSHTITKEDVANLFLMALSTTEGSTNILISTYEQDSRTLHLDQNVSVDYVELYNLQGKLLLRTTPVNNQISLENLSIDVSAQVLIIRAISGRQSAQRTSQQLLILK